LTDVPSALAQDQVPKRHQRLEMAVRDRPVDANRIGDPYCRPFSLMPHRKVEKLHRPLRSRQHDDHGLVDFE
jgi:hypothetical protein